MLDIADLRGGYGLGPVLDGIGLAVAAGEVVSVVGRNGSGKSTLIKAIMGLLPVASGAIRLEGQELLGLPTHRIARQGVAYVPQGRGIFPRLTVKQNLEIGARATGSKNGIPEDVLALFPFLPLLHRSSRCSLLCAFFRSRFRALLVRFRRALSLPQAVPRHRRVG